MDLTESYEVAEMAARVGLVFLCILLFLLIVRNPSIGPSKKRKRH